MNILSKESYLRKRLGKVLLVTALHATIILSIALNQPMVHGLRTIDGVLAADCSDGSCGRRM